VDAVIDSESCLSHLKNAGLLPADLLSVFCVGSAARGWANESSDNNFYVLSREPWRHEQMSVKPAPLDPPTIPVHVTYADGKCWKLKYWTAAQVDQMLGKVSRTRFAARTGDGSPLAEIEELFLERVLTGLPVTGEDWLADCRRRVEAGAFRAFTVTRSLAGMGREARAAGQALAADDVHRAVLAAHSAFGWSVDAVLESHGDFGAYTPKWRARRMREVSSPILPFERYWELETMAGLDPDRPAAWVGEVLAHCEMVAVSINVG
jgi:hypothetical protein